MEEKIYNLLVEVNTNVIDLKKEVIELKERVGCLENDGISLKEELRKISKSLAVIEVEHGNKLDILIDITKLHQEKFIAVEEKIKSCENEIENNSNKIYYLNSKVQAF